MRYLRIAPQLPHILICHVQAVGSPGDLTAQCLTLCGLFLCGSHRVVLRLNVLQVGIQLVSLCRSIPVPLQVQLLRLILTLKVGITQQSTGRQVRPSRKAVADVGITAIKSANVVCCGFDLI